ncbi:MAG: NAD-dependent epimerase/dehydratase family protein [Leptospiraceae bacterium]|nr:NAD-dependent epimerase/dehydratase family protein [Leptospiraceae bacterium]
MLVTGASGFVGGAFVRRYSGQDGLELIGLGRRARPASLPPDVRYVQHNLREAMPAAIASAGGIDVVVHAAAKASPWGSLAEFRADNVKATQNVIEFCQAVGVPKLVYISSSSVYYTNRDQFDLTEESPIGPEFINHYARTKFEGEMLVRQWTGRSAILRPRAVFGPGDTVLFPRMLTAARQGKLPLITRPDPQARGDLIYIDNLIEYIYTAAVQPGIEGDYNLTNNESVPIIAFVCAIFERLGLPLPTRRVSYRQALWAASLIEGVYRTLGIQSEPPVTRFGVQVFGLSKTFLVDKAIRDLGPPRVSIADGVAAFLEWQRRQGE